MQELVFFGVIGLAFGWKAAFWTMMGYTVLVIINGVIKHDS